RSAGERCARHVHNPTEPGDNGQESKSQKTGRSGGGIERPGWRSPPGGRVNFLLVFLSLFSTLSLFILSLHGRWIVLTGGRRCRLSAVTHGIRHQAHIDAAVIGAAAGG